MVDFQFKIINNKGHPIGLTWIQFFWWWLDPTNSAIDQPITGQFGQLFF